jgi:hypothetical protein
MVICLLFVLKLLRSLFYGCMLLSRRAPLSDRFEPAIFKLIYRPHKQPTIFALVDDQNIIIVQMGIVAVLQ